MYKIPCNVLLISGGQQTILPLLGKICGNIWKKSEIVPYNHFSRSYLHLVWIQPDRQQFSFFCRDTLLLTPYQPANCYFLDGIFCSSLGKIIIIKKDLKKLYAQHHILLWVFFLVCIEVLFHVKGFLFFFYLCHCIHTTCSCKVIACFTKAKGSSWGMSITSQDREV